MEKEGGKPQLLLLDDNPEDRLLATRELLRELPELDVTAVGDPGSFREALERGGFALVVTDYHLRWTDGLQVLREVKARWPEVPVVMFTNSGTEEIAVEGMKAGLDDYVVKSPRHLVRLTLSVRSALDRAAARRTAREAETRYRELFNEVPVGLYRATLCGEILDVNPTMVQMLGYPDREELLKAGCPRVFIDAAERAIRDELLVQGETVLGMEMHVQCWSGSIIWVRHSARPIRGPSGEVAYFEGVVVDITDRKRAEERLLEQDRRKDEFLAMLAHELRNPLAAISNGIHLLDQIGSQEGHPGRVRGMIRSQVQHLARIVDDLLDVSRITMGRIELRRERVELNVLVSHCVEVNRGYISARSHAVEVTLPPAPLWVMGDPTRLEQVVSNLLHNAAKYTPPGGRIGLELSPDDGQAVLSVRDTGEGIPPDLLPQIFDLFMQGQRSLDRSQGGLGIGLTLVKSLVAMHGGDVGVVSAGVGQGSEFTIRLPLAESVPGSSEIHPEASEPVRSAGRRVLLVEDLRDAAETMKELLELWGHPTEIAASGPEALRIGPRFQPEVILLDIGLPEMDGYEIARRLRADPRFDRTSLIAITGYGTSEHLRLAREAGFDHHLRKPVDLEALRKLLQSPRALARE